MISDPGGVAPFSASYSYQDFGFSPPGRFTYASVGKGVYILLVSTGQDHKAFKVIKQ